MDRLAKPIHGPTKPINELSPSLPLLPIVPLHHLPMEPWREGRRPDLRPLGPNPPDPRRRAPFCWICTVRRGGRRVEERRRREPDLATTPSYRIRPPRPRIRPPWRRHGGRKEGCRHSGRGRRGAAMVGDRGGAPP